MEGGWKRRVATGPVFCVAPAAAGARRVLAATALMVLDLRVGLRLRWVLEGLGPCSPRIRSNSLCVMRCEL
jgi:hypothetical protein